MVGKLVHRWFEEVRTWIEDFRPDKSQLLRIAAAALTKEEMTQLQLDQLANRFLMHCQSPKIREVLSPERYRDWHQPVPLKLEVTNERRLLQSMDGELIRGVIDRCVLGSDSGRVVRAEIIDFKTDVRPDGLALEAWVQERSEYHAPQLNAYRRVICRQFSLHPEMVQTTLVLLSEEVVMPVDP